MKLQNEKIIKKFLFGKMSEVERFEFEERFITDADLFEEIKLVEDELIEKYLRKWMDSAERTKFEQNLLTTRKGRERVEFSRQMIERFEEQIQTVPAAIKKNESLEAEKDSTWAKLAAMFLTPKIAMAGVLTVIAAIFGSWVLFQNFGTSERDVVKIDNNQNIENLKTPEQAITPTPEIPLVVPKPVDDETNVDSENKSENNSSNKTRKERAKPKKPKKETKKTPIPTKTPRIQKTEPRPFLALFSGTLRSAGKSNVLNLPKEAKSATLQLNLESLEYKTFQAQLTDANGLIIFQTSKLRARNSKINFNIPARNLKDGDYLIKLSGNIDNGDNESVADFQFRIVR